MESTQIRGTQRKLCEPEPQEIISDKTFSRIHIKTLYSRHAIDSTLIFDPVFASLIFFFFFISFAVEKAAPDRENLSFDQGIGGAAFPTIVSSVNCSGLARQCCSFQHGEF